MLLRDLVGAVWVCGAVMSVVVGGAGAEEWESTGGPDGAVVTAVAQAEGVAYAGTRGGFFRSVDGGRTWVMVSETFAYPREVTAVLAEAGGVIVGTIDGGLRRSTDLGETWVDLTQPSPGFATRDLMRSGASLYGVVSDVEIAPNAFVGSLYTSDDDGVSWEAVPLPGDITSAFVEPGLLIVSSVGAFLPTLHRSTDDGETWELIGGEPGAPDAPLSFLSLRDVERSGDVLFVVAEGEGVFRSFDDGVTWERVGGIGAFGLQSHHLEPGPGGIYLLGSSRSFEQPGPGFWFSSDDGETWERQADGLPLIAGLDVSVSASVRLIGGTFGLYRADPVDREWVQSERGISTSFVFTMAGADDRLLAVPANGPDVVSFDGGAWEVGSTTDGGRILDVWIDGDVAFAGTQTDGLFRSVDGGAWSAVNTGVPTYNGTAGLQFREIGSMARVGGAILAGTHLGLEAPAGREGFIITGGGVIRSTDGGLSWSSVNAGLPVLGQNNFFEPLFDPVLSLGAVDATTVLAGLYSRGVFRSTDGGQTWRDSSVGLPLTSGGVFPPRVLDIEMFGGAPYLALGEGIGVARSADGGLSWTLLSAGLPERPVYALAVSDDVLYAGVGGGEGGVGPDDGVYRLRRGVWEPVGTLLQGIGIRDLAVANGTVYAGTIDQGVWALVAPCVADLNGDGVATIVDLLSFLESWLVGDVQGDVTGDGSVDILDVLSFVQAYLIGCG